MHCDRRPSPCQQPRDTKPRKAKIKSSTGVTAMRAEGAWHELGSPLRRVVGRMAPESNPDFVACSESAPRALWRRSAKEAARLDRVSEEGSFGRRSVTRESGRAAPVGQAGCRIGAADVGVTSRQGNRGSVAAAVSSFIIFELGDRRGRVVLSSVALSYRRMCTDYCGCGGIRGVHGEYSEVVCIAFI